MPRQSPKRKIRRSSRSWQRRRQAIARQPLRSSLVGLGLVVGIWLVINILVLRSAAASSVDAFLVLGGSIRREIYAAELVKQQPNVPVLISQGSDDPCIWLVFQQVEAPIQQVWLEKCAHSTFGNFYFSLPILKRWHVHKVKLITSQSHLPRAQWLAQILLGAHGIWVETAIAPEQGVPGNQENWLKTSLDLGRSLLWALVSQIYSPHCADLISLEGVNMTAWQQQGFNCEHQGNLSMQTADLEGILTES